MSKEDLQKHNSQTLSQTAITLLVALAAFLTYVLEKRETGFFFWMLVFLGAAFLVTSMVLGGRGIAKIPNPDGLFNLQAAACLVGFMILVCSYFAIGTPIASETNTLIASISEKVGNAQARLDTLDASIKTNASNVQNNTTSIAQLNEEVRQLNKRLSRLEAHHIPASKTSSTSRKNLTSMN